MNKKYIIIHTHIKNTHNSERGVKREVKNNAYRGGPDEGGNVEGWTF